MPALRRLRLEDNLDFQASLGSGVRLLESRFRKGAGTTSSTQLFVTGFFSFPIQPWLRALLWKGKPLNPSQIASWYPLHSSTPPAIHPFCLLTLQNWTPLLSYSITFMS